jgi:hypothetical protein
MRAAQIDETGLVSNVIVVMEDQAEAFGAIPCPDEVGPGWTYDGTTFSPPPAPPPDTEQTVKDNITSAPDNLTGGPTLAEVFNVHD